MKYLITGIIAIITALIAINYKSLKKIYRAEVDAELKGQGNGKPDMLTEVDVAGLPDPVKKYFRYCGLLDRERVKNAKIEWKEFYLKMDPGKDWTAGECTQFNGVIIPARIVYMRESVRGLSFEARDKFQNGEGNMWVRVARLYTLYDVKGQEMNHSALVTILAEALIVPGYATQPYIRWEPVDQASAKATLTYNNIVVSGIFYFNEKGEFTRFTTDDRHYFEASNGTTKNIKWSAEVGNYKENNGIKFPSELKATWHTDTGDYTYVRGTIAAVNYNINAQD